MYTWGIKGYYDTEKYSVVLSQPMQNDKAWLTQLAIFIYDRHDNGLADDKISPITFKFGKHRHIIFYNYVKGDGKK